MFRTETVTAVSKLDGLPLSVLIAEPERGVQPRCTVQLVHGMAEYKERYLPLMEYLTARGCICVIHDHRGHGMSMAGERDKGYFGGVGGAGLVADALQLSRYIQSLWPGLPLFLFGHSMGSLVARCMLREGDGLFRGVILSGPPTENPAARAGEMLAKLQRALMGGHSRGRLLNAMAFGGYYRRFPQSPCAWICSDPETVREYEAHPMCGFTFTADGFVGLMELMGTTYSHRGWGCTTPQLPILLLGGEDDPCIGGREKFEGAMAHLRGVGYAQVSGKLYPGLRHEICNEGDKLTVFGDIYAHICRCLD